MVTDNFILEKLAEATKKMRESTEPIRYYSPPKRPQPRLIRIFRFQQQTTEKTTPPKKQETIPVKFYNLQEIS